MEKELDYLKDKIEELTQSRDYYMQEVMKMETSKMKYDMDKKLTALNTEIELLENILHFVWN